MTHLHSFSREQIAIGAGDKKIKKKKKSIAMPIQLETNKTKASYSVKKVNGIQ